MLRPEEEVKDVFNGQRPLSEQEPGRFEEPQIIHVARA